MKKTLTTITLLLLVTLGFFVSCNADATESLFEAKNSERKDKIIFTPVTVSGTGIKVGEKSVVITTAGGTTPVLSEEILTAIANKINAMQENAAVSAFKNTNLSNATGINGTGLEKIIKLLQTKTNDDTAKSNIGGKSSSDVDLWINVELSSIEVDTNDYSQLTYIEFDVTPIATVTVTNNSGDSVSVNAEIGKDLLVSKVRFRLPIDKSVADSTVAVYHTKENEKEFFGNYSILTDGNGDKYIEIESDNFSKYGYNNLNENTAGAKIGNTLYLKFADAVASVKNDETITLLKPATGTVTIDREITFTVDKNGKEFNATVNVGEGFELKTENPSATTIKYTCIPEGSFIGLCFTAKEDGSTVKLTKNGSPAEVALQYKTSNEDWTDYTIDQEITLSKAGEKVYFKAKTTNAEFSKNNSDNYTFVMTGKIAASGNIMSLVDSSCESTTIPCNGCFAYLFYGCESLTAAPELPAETLAASCYDSMFLGCESLKTAPKLPAETMATECYSSMFAYCGLESLPEGLLPSTTLAVRCYQCMFMGSGLTSLPEGLLPSTTLATECYSYMFAYCGLESLPEGLLPSTTLAERCYQYMFTCSGLKSVPEGLLPSTTLAERCYYEMFSYCGNLKVAPKLPADNLAVSCYQRMFYLCTGLLEAPELPAKNLAVSCYRDMFATCTSLGKAPELPATTLADYCYYEMFDFCTNLAEAPELLPATTLADYCYYRMFAASNCLEKSPVLPAKVLKNNCYASMFDGCNHLVEITMLATDIDATNCLANWVHWVNYHGTFYKASGTDIPSGDSGIPSAWEIKSKYTVTFDLSGTTLEIQTVEEGNKVTRPDDPTAPVGSIDTFNGWYKTKDATTGELSDEWNFDSDTVTADITLYAQWTTIISKIVGTNANVPALGSFDWEQPADFIDYFPTNAWVSDTGNKAFWVSESGNEGFAMIYREDEEVKVFGPDDTDTFIKNGNTYVCTSVIPTLGEAGTYTCTVNSGVFTSLKFEHSNTDFGIFDGTYAAPN